MAARLKQCNNDEHKTARRFGRRVGRFVAKVTGVRSHQMSSNSGQLAVATAREAEQKTAERETNNDLVFKMQPLSRRRVKIRVLAYRDAEPRFVYDGMNEEIAAVK